MCFCLPTSEFGHAQVTTSIDLPPDTCELAQSSGLSQVQSYPLVAAFEQVHEPKTGESKHSQPENQSINQSVNQSINQPIKQSINRSINQSTNQSIN